MGDTTGNYEIEKKRRRSPIISYYLTAISPNIYNTIHITCLKEYNYNCNTKNSEFFFPFIIIEVQTPIDICTYKNVYLFVPFRNED